MSNIFKKIAAIFKEDVPPPKSKEAENEEIISIYRQIKRAVPDHDEPNYALAEKVFREFNDFNLKNTESIELSSLIPVPKSLLPYPKNYIKCAYYIYLEQAAKKKERKICDLIQAVGTSLFLGYPDYPKYKEEKLKMNKFLRLEIDDLSEKSPIWKEDRFKDINQKESLKELRRKYEVSREQFKKLYGMYEVSEEDYNSSPSSIDSTDEKLIYDFGFLPEIEEDVDMSKLLNEAKKK